MQRDTWWWPWLVLFALLVAADIVYQLLGGPTWVASLR